MLHQHKLCVYKGTKITDENVVFTALVVPEYQLFFFFFFVFFCLLCKYCFGKFGKKKVYSRGVLERVDRSGYSKQNYFFRLRTTLNLYHKRRIHIALPCAQSLTSISNKVAIKSGHLSMESFLKQYHLSHVMRKPVIAICEQQRRRSACASAQSDQHLCCSLLG